MSPTSFFFFFSLFFSFFQTSFLSFPLLAFAPYLCHSLIKDSLRLTLWRCTFIGLLSDLFSSTFFFGGSSVLFCLCVLLLSKTKEWFFSDKIYSLSFLTFFFSFFYSLLFYFFFYVDKHPLELTPYSFATEALLMPLADACYAFIFFTLPETLYILILRKRAFSP